MITLNWGRTPGLGQPPAFELPASQLFQGIGGPLAPLRMSWWSAGRASGSRAAWRIWPASGAMTPRTATIWSMVVVNHTPAAQSSVAPGH
jgi:hypothetical protein